MIEHIHGKKHNLIVVGTQWGDEGKAKIIDLLAGHFDIIGRYQGGGNAGHTVVVQGEKYIFHLVPTGILHAGKKVLLGNGMVIHLPTLVTELEQIAARGLSFEDRLVISSRAHVILPSHIQIEKHTEESASSVKIGTTLRGIGPTYEDKIARRGLVMADLLDDERFRDKLEQNTAWKQALASQIYKSTLCSVSAMIEEYRPHISKIRPYIRETSRWLHEQLCAGSNLLCEGAQGTHLDVDHGTYPFVTSSNSTAGGAITGLGIGPCWFDQVLGICKAYVTRVGAGAFPTEDLEQAGETIRQCGHEFGSTTGRPRRCGWFDVPVMRYAVRINGLSALALTKLDVLSGFRKIKICQAYELGSRRLDEFPEYPSSLDQVCPEYIEVEGWLEDISRCRSIEDLPKAARNYLEVVQDLVGVEIAIVSVGPERDQAFYVPSARFFDQFPDLINSN
ncbi:adenylosuccinate synthase [bacterium]|nr:adenylosuccinate synthase [bacterium]